MNEREREREREREKERKRERERERESKRKYVYVHARDSVRERESEEKKSENKRESNQLTGYRHVWHRRARRDGLAQQRRCDWWDTLSAKMHPSDCCTCTHNTQWVSR